jgi:hypothetical protein
VRRWERQGGRGQESEEAGRGGAGTLADQLKTHDYTKLQLRCIVKNYVQLCFRHPQQVAGETK